jgi:hypothetical protein
MDMSFVMAIGVALARLNLCWLQAHLTFKIYGRLLPAPFSLSPLMLALSERYPLILKQFGVRARAHENDRVAVGFEYQQEVAANVAFTVVGPVTL